MNEQIWKILLVDDNQEDYFLTREQLRHARGGKYTLDWAESYAEGIEKILSEAYDAILMDYQLGELTGLDLVSEAVRRGCRAPIILLTAWGSDDIDLAAMQLGVTDYLAKIDATPTTLDRSLRYAILQKQAEEALRKTKEELETRVEERTQLLRLQNKELADEVDERMRAQAELAAIKSRLIDRDEEERLSLARELHDGPMQDLYGLIFQVDALAGQINGCDVDEQIKAIRGSVIDVIHSLRQMSRDLRPPALAPYGLEKAIRSHIEGLRELHPDLSFRLKLDKDGQALPEPMRLALYRIYQVAITNVARHAEAALVEVTFQLQDDQVILEVKDNGKGFEAPQRLFEFARRGSLGLAGAFERAEAVGGRLEVTTSPGQGTCLRVTAPRQAAPDLPGSR